LADRTVRHCGVYTKNGAAQCTDVGGIIHLPPLTIEESARFLRVNLKARDECDRLPSETTLPGRA